MLRKFSKKAKLCVSLSFRIHGRYVSSLQDNNAPWMQGAQSFAEFAGSKRLIIGITSLAIIEIGVPL